jgi:hypothetical protein
MYLTDFINSLHKDVGDFEKYWRKNRKELPEHFPMEFSEEAWCEQWECWLQSEGRIEG